MHDVLATCFVITRIVSSAVWTVIHEVHVCCLVTSMLSCLSTATLLFLFTVLVFAMQVWVSGKMIVFWQPFWLHLNRSTCRDWSRTQGEQRVCRTQCQCVHLYTSKHCKGTVYLIDLLIFMIVKTVLYVYQVLSECVVSYIYHLY